MNIDLSNINEILFIEDLEDTVNYLKSKGVNAINVNEIK